MARSNELIEALSALIVQQPFFACLLVDLLEIHESEHIMGTRTALPTAYTDGKNIVVNPKFMKALDVKERIFVLAHEVTHVILQHPQRMKSYLDLGYGPDLNPFQRGRFNKAADYVINAYLNELKVGKQPLDTLFNPNITSKDLVDDVYLKLPPEDDDNSSGSGWDHHEPQTNGPSKASIQRAVAQAAAAQKQMGTLPAGLQRLVDGIIEPQITWTEHLRSLIVTLNGSDQTTWHRPNRRRLAVAPHVYWPGRCGVQAGPLAVEIDTSGSIGDDELKVFFGELHGILSDVHPEKIHVMFVDSELYNDEVVEIDDTNDLLELQQKAGGGGGTDMTVVFSELQKREIEVEYVIVFTDGYCDFGEDPGIPTIWCITTPDIKSPWGINVHVKLPGRQ